MKKENNLSFNHIRMRQIRESKKLSQKVVAEYLGISQSSYNDMEQGKTKVKVDNLILLVQILQVDMRCFFEAQQGIYSQLTFMEEKDLLEQTCERLIGENKKLQEALREQQNLFLNYKKNSEELLSVLRLKVRSKKFYLNLLLMACILTISVFIFSVYFEKTG